MDVATIIYFAVGFPAAVGSFAVILLGARQLLQPPGSPLSSWISVVNAILGTFWLLSIAVSAWLLTGGAPVPVALPIAFLAFASLASGAHSLVAIGYRRNQPPPCLRVQEQLLAAGVTASRAEEGRASGHPPSVRATPNPFKTTYGVIPGTSSTGYVLWLPTAEERQRGAYQPGPPGGPGGSPDRGMSLFKKEKSEEKEGARLVPMAAAVSSAEDD
ncbi:hypothetical protein FOA52_002454 [Chlamydomonas sp. UWO 241]|nr:hypothetical protein FOA52_002454 [Chlamydomonas sp. UWO 241]